LRIAALALLDTDKDVRIALALNPNCPPEFLGMLLSDANAGVREAAGLNPQSHEAGLRFSSTRTRRVLVKLSKDAPAMRRLLARLPGQTVAEQRSFARDDQWEVRLACASNPETESSVLALLTNDPDVDVRKAVGAHSTLDEATRFALISDEQPGVREALVTHADDEALHRLSMDESITVRAAIANHPRSSATILERLGEDGDASVREFVAGHPNTSLATRARLAASDEPVVKRAILKWASQSLSIDADRSRVIAVLLGGNPVDAQTWTRLRQGDPTLSRARLHRLAYATDWGTDSFISPHTSPRALSVLATFNDWRLRQAVAAHPHTPEPTIARLTRDSDYDVRSSAAAHRLLRQRDAKRLSSDPHFAVRLAIAERADTPTAILDSMIFDDTDHVREAVLANPRLSSAALELHDGVMRGTFVPQRTLIKLSKGNSMIRKIIAAHPYCSEQLRAELAVDDDWRIREAVANHPDSDSRLLETLANDADRDVRGAVARHANTPLESLLTLSGDTDFAVRTAVLANPNLLDSQRQACLGSAHRRSLISMVPTERIAALLSPLCTERHLDRRAFWQSAQWLERFVVAGHPRTKADIMRQLTNDAHRAVVAQAHNSLANRDKQVAQPQQQQQPQQQPQEES
jgi:Leucine rich repeat variant